MGSGTGLGRVRGLGSAKSGSHHWWLQRVTAAGNLILGLWLIFALLRLPDLDHKTVTTWLQSPLASVPMALMVVNVCWHFRLGMQVFIEDYVHGGMRILTLGLLHLWTFGVGGFALWSILKIALMAAAPELATQASTGALPQ
jgi:succinate dehydrogenase / fumarate reductase, membrane anchor subunit